MITDDKVLTRCAAKYYNTFKVPTMIVDSSKKKRYYTNADKSQLDVSCDNDNIGIIVNLSQELNTLMWDRINRYGDWKSAMSAYYDNCLLSILSEIAIDSTKREYPIDSIEELKIVRARYNDKDEEGRAIRPYFFAHVAKKKGYYDSKHRCYKKHMAPMDYLQEIVGRRSNSGPSTDKICYTIGDLIKDITLDDLPRRGYIDLILSMIREMDYNSRMLYQVKSDVIADKERKRELANEYYRKCIDGIRNLNLSNATMRELLIEIDNPNNSNIRRKLWSIVFSSLGNELQKFLKDISRPVYTLEERKSGDIGDVYIYGTPYVKKIIS